MPKICSVPYDDLYEIAKLSAKTYAGADLLLLSRDEQALVKKLEQAGFMQKEKLPDGFAGDAIDDDDGG